MQWQQKEGVGVVAGRGRGKGVGVWVTVKRRVGRVSDTLFKRTQMNVRGLSIKTVASGLKKKGEEKKTSCSQSDAVLNFAGYWSASALWKRPPRLPCDRSPVFDVLCLCLWRTQLQGLDRTHRKTHTITHTVEYVISKWWTHLYLNLSWKLALLGLQLLKFVSTNQLVLAFFSNKCQDGNQTIQNLNVLAVYEQFVCVLPAAQSSVLAFTARSGTIACWNFQVL